MNRKLVPLLVVLALVIGVAPSAMADHCFRCVRFPPSPQFVCARVTSAVLGGYPNCVYDEVACHLSGSECDPHTFAAASLASEYTVASVERLDERDAKSEEPQRAAAHHLR